MKTRDTVVYLVRHGETDMNAENRCQGTMDVAMNAAGEAQISALAQRLAAITFDAAYSSTLQRARKSAQLILADSSVALHEDIAFIELAYGDWQGLTHEEWPEGMAAAWRDSPWSMSFPNGESLPAVRERAVNAFDRIVALHQGEIVLVVAHGHVNRALLTHTMGLADDRFWTLALDNGEAWKLVFRTENSTTQLISADMVAAPVTRQSAQAVLDSKTKPLGALGLLEECAVRLAVLQQSHTPKFSAARICVFGGDHGVTDEGVSAYPRAVTAEMMKNFGAGGAAINVLARANSVEVEVIDVGVDADITHVTNIKHYKVARGTRNFVVDAAMSDDELSAAMAVGGAAARRASADGMDAIGLGEMGIGNTTSASALLTMLTGESPTLTVGLGTGVSPETLQLKREVVERAIALHGTRSRQVGARECLRRVGGLELAAIAGAALEAAHLRMVVIADGFISTVAILCAALMARELSEQTANAFSDSVFLSHRSAERGHQLAINAYSAATSTTQRPLLDLELRLGEGTGAALAVPLLRSAAAIMREMATFESAGVSTSDGAPHA